MTTLDAEWAKTASSGDVMISRRAFERAVELLEERGEIRRIIRRDELGTPVNYWRAEAAGQMAFQFAL